MHRLKAIKQICPTLKTAAILTTAAEAALQAGRIIKKFYGGSFTIRHKGAIDLVTGADEAAEAAILEVLKQGDIKVKIITEESSVLDGKIPEEPAWLIDPLDGTTNFAHGFPWFGTSIAYMEKDEPLAGVLYCPMLDELFYAGKDCGAWLNGSRIRVSSVSSLIDGLLATGFPYDIQQESEPVIKALGTVLTRCQGVRRAGAAALDLAYVACGRLDGFWEIKLKPWDTGAGQLLITEAGGRISTLGNQPYNPYIPEVLASNGHLHSELSKLLKEFTSRVV